MLTFTHDGNKLLVANEGTPNVAADTPYLAPDPPGSVSIIDVETRTVIATAGFDNVPQFGDNLRTNVGMDFEPEYIAVDHDGSRAFVTLQDANGIAILDLSSNAFTEIIGLGAKDFSLPGNEFDPKDNDGMINFINADAKGLYMPDAVASYKWRGRTYLVLANEGDFREDNDDRSAAGGAPYFAAAPLDRLRISNRDSSPGNLYAAGARSMSIREADGTLVYDSGSILDTEAHKRGIYDDSRSRDKGVEPEGVALLDIRGRTYAFVGLERTRISSVAVFDMTNPNEARFLDLIVTPGDLSPEGLAAFAYRGGFYLAISNEVPASAPGLQHDAVPGESSARIRGPCERASLFCHVVTACVAVTRNSGGALMVRQFRLLSLGVILLFVATASRELIADPAPPPAAAIAFASDVADAMIDRLVALLFREFEVTTPANAHIGSAAIGQIFNDRNDDMRLVGTVAPLSANNNPGDAFETAALEQAMLGNNYSLVERVRGQWYSRKSIALSTNFSTACVHCHANFANVENPWVGALMVRSPIP